ncbi:hypothetical protein ACIGXM_14560 [Kitasatospora sp. NPDC052896]|uniref:hypothetical protein n=1 Tax=Kitasatospora sp. NPDC052896 TaxID=3364061 RepID=UPI0037C84144
MTDKPECPVHSIFYLDVVCVAGRRGLVSETDDRGRPRIQVEAFNADGGGWSWFRPEDVTKLQIEFIGMPNEDHSPEYMHPIETWQGIPHVYDEYLTWGMDAGCMYCGAPENHPVHIPDDQQS